MTGRGGRDLVRFSDKVALVTGAGRGIGRAIAVRLAQEGSDVAVVDLIAANAGETADLVRGLGRQAAVYVTDVSDPEAVQHAVNGTIETLGNLHVLVNNAGITRDMLLIKMKEEDWQKVLDVNLTSAFLCSKFAVKHMMRQRYGRIVNMASVVGLAGQAGQTNYAASKAGLIGFTKSLAKEVGSRGITVNAVAPGFIPTALTDVLPDEQRAAAIAATPLGRLGTVEDVASAVCFLASDEASFITGQVLSVDGGLVMQ
jgi:3-oxoacyl-[acyl-carrier protein] reductase